MLSALLHLFTIRLEEENTKESELKKKEERTVIMKGLKILPTYWA